MSQNLISANFSAETIARMDAALATLEEIFAPFSDITADALDGLGVERVVAAGARALRRLAEVGHHPAAEVLDRLLVGAGHEDVRRVAGRGQREGRPGHARGGAVLPGQRRVDGEVLLAARVARGHHEEPEAAAVGDDVARRREVHEPLRVGDLALCVHPGQAFAEQLDEHAEAGDRRAQHRRAQCVSA